MTKTLDEQIAARKQQAQDRELYSKAEVVAKKLGKRGWEENHGSFSRISHTFNDAASGLVVRHDADEYHRKDPEVPSGSSSVTVSYKGKVVYDSSGNYAGLVHAYLPGAWEKKLDALQPAAKGIAAKERAAAAQEAAARKQAAEAAKRKQWGL